MAVGLNPLSKLHSVDGIKLGTTDANIKHTNKDDITLIEICDEANVASVFTKNKFCAAPVIVAKKHLNLTSPRYLLVNTGNANAGTGKAGLQTALDCCAAVSLIGKCDVANVLPFSTGVIGETLNGKKIKDALPAAFENLHENHWEYAANAIMTTDTQPKAYSKKTTIGNDVVTITGIAKGSGMIRPDMATMLAYIATDANVELSLLQSLLEKANAVSFNAITVDGDTSTNDACILIAAGKSSVQIKDEESVGVFYSALVKAMQFLAQSIIRDAEGATKFITIFVENGLNVAECEAVAYTIAHSPLVKTAFFASDPNWGRILAAVGRSGINDLDIEKVTIKLNEQAVIKNGELAVDYSEIKGQEIMNQQEISISIDLSRGQVSHTIWTSDLSHEYIKINAEYRT